MKIFAALALMLFLHVVADYNLQGIMASMKQKSWWTKELGRDVNHTIYKNDYKAALSAHCIEWAFVVMLPCFVKFWTVADGWTGQSVWAGLIYVVLFAANSLFHYAADDLKANDKKISLIGDQFLHLLQLGVTWAIWSGFVGW